MIFAVIYGVLTIYQVPCWALWVSFDWQSLEVAVFHVKMMTAGLETYVAELRREFRVVPFVATTPPVLI